MADAAPARTDAACAPLAAARAACWARAGGRDTEACLAEELREKRCVAFAVCPAAAAAFYGAPGAPPGVCALWAEAFAFPDDAGAAAGRAAVLASRDLVAHCTRATHEVARCVAPDMPQ
jgi:hypothetical protein